MRAPRGAKIYLSTKLASCQPTNLQFTAGLCVRCCQCLLDMSSLSLQAHRAACLRQTAVRSVVLVTYTAFRRLFLAAAASTEFRACSSMPRRRLYAFSGTGVSTGSGCGFKFRTVSCSVNTTLQHTYARHLVMYAQDTV